MKSTFINFRAIINSHSYDGICEIKKTKINNENDIEKISSFIAEIITQQFYEYPEMIIFHILKERK